ncbi:molybdenum cofactor biosynthesis protein MoaE, partial [Salmonella enterica]|uniref:molybdenum cofactor biosynthesis protein MoaE n=1 Tax=Salmonella enterica TaxID=28901 RepID=UPI003296866B
MRDAPVAASELLALVARPEAGAVALFVGVVRDHDPQASGEVVALDYTCHPSAPERLGEIVAGVLASMDPEESCAVAAVHRIGHLV